MSVAHDFPKRVALSTPLVVTPPYAYRTPDAATPNSTSASCPGAPFKSIDRTEPLRPRRLVFDPPTPGEKNQDAEDDDAF